MLQKAAVGQAPGARRFGAAGGSDLVDRRERHTVCHGERRLRYQVARAGTDDVSPQDRTARPVGDHLDHAVRGAIRMSTPKGGEREACGGDPVAARPRLGLRQADARHLGVGEGGRRYGPVVDTFVVAADDGRRHQGLIPSLRCRTAE